MRERERWYATRPDYVARMTERGGRYLFHIVEELDKRGMPTELALLPFIESAYNPQAMSVARASGMWQFIPSTGRDFELKQNVFRDDRRDVLASTRAALDYLQKLLRHVRRLAPRARRLQLGRRQRAAGDRASNQRAGLPTDYESLRMPAETQDYVPKLQAVKNIVARPGELQPAACPSCYNHPYFLSVPIERDIDVAVAIKLAGMPLEEFQHLNPQMNRPVILAAGTPQVLLPYDNANRFVRELPQHRGPLASWTAWVAPKTMKPAEAARAVGMSEDELARGQPHSGAHADQGRLDAARAARQRAARRRLEHDRRQRRRSRSRPTRRRCARCRCKAGKRDSVASVAKRYRVSPAQVARVERRRRRARASRRGRRSSSTPPTKARQAATARSKPAPGGRARPQRRAPRAAARARAAARRRAPARRPRFAGAGRQALSGPPLSPAAATASAPVDEGVGDGAQVDVLELAADRHAARQPRDAHARATAAPRRARAPSPRPRR